MTPVEKCKLHEFQKMNTNTHAYFSDLFQYKQNNIILHLKGKKQRTVKLIFCYYEYYWSLVETSLKTQLKLKNK